MVVGLGSRLSWVFCIAVIIAIGILSRVVHTGLPVFDKYRPPDLDRVFKPSKERYLSPVDSPAPFDPVGSAQIGEWRRMTTKPGITWIRCTVCNKSLFVSGVTRRYARAFMRPIREILTARPAA